METTLTFGQWLRRRRKTLDLTQNELAARVPCAKGTIRRLESEIPAVLHNLAHVYLMQSEAKRAQTLFTEGLQLHRDIGNRMGMVECLIGLAAVAIMSQRPQRAATLSGVIDALLTQLGTSPFVTEQAIYQQAVDAAKGSLNQPDWDLAYRAGQALPLTEALNFAAKS